MHIVRLLLAELRLIKSNQCIHAQPWNVAPLEARALDRATEADEG